MNRSRLRPCSAHPLLGSALVAAIAFGCFGSRAQAARSRPRLYPRFGVRVQFLSGLSFALVKDADLSRRLVAFAPLDVEVAARVAGPVSVSAGVLALVAPFSASVCAAGGLYRPHALASVMGLRLDLNNSRKGSWWSPWVDLRMGVGGQVVAGDFCSTRTQLAPVFSPRLGVDLWMGKAAASFALGYDALPASSVLATMVGLTLPL